MLYYVRTGSLSTSMVADSPRKAAILALGGSPEGHGLLTIVSEEEIRGEDLDNHIFFSTESIMEDCIGMQIID